MRTAPSPSSPPRRLALWVAASAAIHATLFGLGTLIDVGGEEGPIGAGRARGAGAAVAPAFQLDLRRSARFADAVPAAEPPPVECDRRRLVARWSEPVRETPEALPSWEWVPEEDGARAASEGSVVAGRAGTATFSALHVPVRGAPVRGGVARSADRSPAGSAAIGANAGADTPRGASIAVVRADLVAPVPVETPVPAYPRESVQLGERGTVRCRIEIDARGTVTGVAVVRSSGHARLDRAAQEGLLAWRFRPARRGGTPIASRLEHEVTFQPETAATRP